MPSHKQCLAFTASPVQSFVKILLIKQLTICLRVWSIGGMFTLAEQHGLVWEALRYLKHSPLYI